MSSILPEEEQHLDFEMQPRLGSFPTKISRIGPARTCHIPGRGIHCEGLPGTGGHADHDTNALAGCLGLVLTASRE